MMFLASCCPTLAPDTVLKDVKPTLEGILSRLLKEPVVVEELPVQDHRHIPSKRVYLTRAAYTAINPA
jgi:hypothetical protein